MFLTNAIIELIININLLVKQKMNSINNKGCRECRDLI